MQTNKTIYHRLDTGEWEKVRVIADFNKMKFEFKPLKTTKFERDNGYSKQQAKQWEIQ